VSILAAVGPDGLGVVYGDGECSAAISVARDEARVKAWSTIISRKLDARVPEAATADGMVFGHKFEDDGVANVSCDGWRIVGESSVATNNDGVRISLRSSRSRVRGVGI